MRKSKLCKTSPLEYNIVTARGLNKKANNKLVLSSILTGSGVMMVQNIYNDFESMLPKFVVGAASVIIGGEVIIHICDFIKMVKSRVKLIELDEVLKGENINISLLNLVLAEDANINYEQRAENNENFLIIENGKLKVVSDLKAKKTFYVDKEKEEEKEITDLIDKAWMLKK